MSLTICYIQLMAIDLNWLVGRRLSGLIRREYDWSFSFNDSTSISVESVWRLQGRQGVVVTSTDDGQLFGLKFPVSAADRPPVAQAERYRNSGNCESRQMTFSCTSPTDWRLNFCVCPADTKVGI
jgi:hypothetical protein